MAADLWQNLSDYLVSKIEEALGEDAYPDDRTAVRQVESRLIIDPDDWTDPDRYELPLVHVYAVRLEPSVSAQMHLGGQAKTHVSLDLVYPFYLVAAVAGTLQQAPIDARAIAGRLLDVARQLPANTGEVDTDDYGAHLQGWDIGPQTLDIFDKPTTDAELAFYATVTQTLRANCYIP